MIHPALFRQVISSGSRMVLEKCRVKQKGQTLLEILLAFSVSILVLSAIIIGITTSLSNTQYTRNQNSANSYAQEGMSVVKQIRGSSWNNFCSYKAINYCLSQDLSKLSDYDGNNCIAKGIVGIFVRKVELVHNSSDCCPDNTKTCASGTCESSTRGSKVTVKVSWSDNKCPVGTPLCHKVELITCLSNVDQKQSP